MGLNWEQIRADNQARLRAEGKTPDADPAPVEKPAPRPRRAAPRPRKTGGPGRGRPGVPNVSARSREPWVYEDMLQLYRDGWRIGAISFALDIARTTVTWHIKQAGMFDAHRSRNGALSREELKDIARYWVRRGMLEEAGADDDAGRIGA